MQRTSHCIRALQFCIITFYIHLDSIFCRTHFCDRLDLADQLSDIKCLLTEHDIRIIQLVQFQDIINK